MAEQAGDAEEEQAPNEGEAAPEGDEHRVDGTDLARAMLRSALGGAAGALGSGGKPPRRGRSGSASGRRRTRRLRPGEAQLSGAYPDGRDPQTLSAEVDRIIGERGWGLDLQVRGVFARWAELVGPEIGEHSTPESLTDGVLVVRAHSTAWATQLKMLTGGILRRLNEELGNGTVSLVQVLGPDAPSWKHGLRSARGRGPRDTYG